MSPSSLFGEKWTPTATDRLRDLIAEGHSAGQMSRILSNEFGADFSRNAVIGKAHRLKLNGKAGGFTGKPGRPQGSVSVPRAQVKRRQKWRARIATVDGVRVEEMTEPAPIGDVAGGCRWLHGDDMRARDQFCGAPVVALKSYCPFHCKRAFIPITPAMEKQRKKSAKFFSKIWG